ncbi:hypothetical protein QBC45DRAFT_6560 [Copromyces sp. CBS 386.78]|nr:hypothetical protein QBC45DRAFT_6560 [Copromyces sp. CBS 386.78]
MALHDRGLDRKNASSLPLLCFVPLLSIGLQHNPRMLFRSEFRFALRLRCAAIFAPIIINRISIQTGKGISYPRGDVVVLGSWRVNFGLCIVLTAWFRCGFFCYLLFILYFFFPVS